MLFKKITGPDKHDVPYQPNLEARLLPGDNGSDGEAPQLHNCPAESDKPEFPYQPSLEVDHDEEREDNSNDHVS